MRRGTHFQTESEAHEERKWFLIDGENQIVGRLATKVARILRGKDNPKFVPHHDCGGFVVVTNVDKIRFTGEKAEKKVYHQHTGYVGNLKSETAASLLARRPERVLYKAVQGMIPKTPLGRSQMTKLKMYTGSDHPHTAQQPQIITVEARK